MAESLYSQAIQKLNSLQSQQSGTCSIEEKLQKTRKYLEIIEVNHADIDKFSPIHIAGTKGKGSTCNYIEAILRHHGYKTGLFTSPHLVYVRERIKINGQCLSEDRFVSYFNYVYERLKHTEVKYFQFLTIMAFYVFKTERVDVGVIEAGVGGEYDCTNVITPKVVGITSLGLDHVNVLGNTLSEIAWHKAGVFKTSIKAFSVNQDKEAWAVLVKRAEEKKCQLALVCVMNLSGMDRVQKLNGSLAIHVCNQWLLDKGDNLQSSHRVIDILKNISLPGRTQVLVRNNITYHLDGAHTIESLDHCASWFFKISTNKNKILIINITKNRQFKLFFGILSKIKFTFVIFTTNLTSIDVSGDLTNVNESLEKQLEKCREYCESWRRVTQHSADTCCIQNYVSDAIDKATSFGVADVLVTGSFHLVGSVLSILDPGLTG